MLQSSHSRHEGKGCIIFDLDGTLVFFKIKYMRARIEVITKLKELGFPDYLLTRQQTIMETLNLVKNYLQSRVKKPEKIPMIVKEVEKIISKYEMDAARKTSLVPGTKGILKFLRRNNFKLGLFTLENRLNTKFILNKFAIKNFFDAIVTRDDTEKLKPDPGHLTMVIESLKFKANNIVVVGDSPVDFMCAKQINAITIARLNKRHNKEDLIKAGADYLVNNLLEIKEILTNIF